MLKDKIFKSILLICLMIVGGNMWAQSPVKCTSTDDLKAGDVYYISAAEEYSSTASVMGMSTGGNYFPASTFGEAPCELTLGGNATSGWTFSYLDGATTYYLDPTAAKAICLKRNTFATSYGKFTISFDNESGAVIITSKGKTSRNVIMFDSSSNYYSCDSGTENAVYLYKKDGSINPDESQDYTVSFSVNGNIVQSKAYKENAAVTPPSVEAINSKAFVGWVKTSTVDAATIPSYETITKATEDAVYYAVFADAQTGTGRVTDVLTREWTEVASTYQSWSGKELNSTAVYAGKTAGGDSYIQLRNNSTGSNPSYDGIITTTSGGKVKTVTVEWNSSTVSGRTLNIYGKNTAYNEVKDLFGSNTQQGTLLGTIKYGTSTSLTITGDYEYIALASASGAMYLNSISIEWEGTTEVYSNFTTLPYAATITLNAACHDTDGIVYSTYSNGSAFVVPSDINVYEVAANGKSLSLHAYETGDVVPAKTGLLVAANEGGNYSVALTNSEGTSILGMDNALRPSGDVGIAATSMNEGNGKMYYRLTMHNGTEFGFWWGAENGAAFGLAANKAYLVIDTTSSGGAKPAMGIVFNTNEATAISSVVTNNAANAVRYNLNGQRILSTRNSGGYKGIVIMNGKKYINK